MAERKQTPQLPIAAALVCLIVGVILGWTLRPAFDPGLSGTEPAKIEQGQGSGQGSGDQGSGDQGSGKQGSGNQGSGDQGSGNQGSGNQGSGNQGSGNQGGGEAGTSVDDLVWDGDERVTDPATGVTVEFDGEYTSKDEVALYIHAFGDVPSNFVTKTKARNAGWVSSEGNLWDVLPGKSIGGGGFDNIEGELPLEYDPERSFKECDINYEGGYRGSERIVWSDDGYIFYTGDHYETFTLLYGP